MISDKHVDILRSWKRPVRMNGTTYLSSRITPFLMRYVSSHIPPYVHPNLLTICGFLCVAYSYVISLRIQPYDTYTPPYIFGTLTMILLMGLYYVLGIIEPTHAEKTRQDTAVGELLRTILNIVSVLCTVLSACNVWGYANRNGILTSVFWVNVILLSRHLNRYLNTDDTSSDINHRVGVLEIVVGYCFLLTFSLLRNYFPDNVYRMYTYSSYWLCMLSCFYLCIRTLFVLLSHAYIKEQHEYVNTVFAISLSYIIRGFGAVSFTLTPDVSSHEHVGILGNLAINGFAEGMMLSIPTFELALCTMAKKQFNPLIIVCMMAGLVDHFLSVVIAVAYYCYTFYMLSYILNIPLFRVKVRVYCSGVFDMCHRGHMLLFQRAVSYGDELVVGVHSDADVASYKRPPTLCQEERYETVSVCKYVSEVICNAPLYLTKEYLDKHRIDIVVCSSEYDRPDDKYYAVPRQMGILKVLPRTNGISSSDILCIVMSRVQSI